MITKNDRGEWVIPDEDVEAIRFNVEGDHFETLFGHLSAILPAPEEKPAPCPWCGRQASISPVGMTFRWVYCTSNDRGILDCRARGPSHKTAAEAIAAWNKMTNKMAKR